MKVRYEEVGTVTLSGRKIAAGVVALAVLAGGGYALYELNWAVKSNSTDRQAAISRQNQGFQQAKVDEINRKLSDLSNLAALAQSGQLDDQGLAANKAQSNAIKGQVCSDYRSLTGAVKNTLDTDLVVTLQTMCPVVQP